jgi:hypothetical protein
VLTLVDDEQGRERSRTNRFQQRVATGERIVESRLTQGFGESVGQHLGVEPGG